MEKETLIKRKIKEGFIFLDREKNYRSKTFITRENRDQEMNKYLIEQIEIKKKDELKRKKERDLIYEKRKKNSH